MLPATHHCHQSVRYIQQVLRAAVAAAAAPELPENNSASSAPVALLPLFLPVGYLAEIEGTCDFLQAVWQ